MHTSLNRLAILALALALASCSIGAQAPKPAETPAQAAGTSGASPSGDLVASIAVSRASILQAINVRRAEASAPALLSNPSLDKLAALRAEDLATRAYLDHEDPSSGGVAVEGSLAALGYSGPASELLFAARDPLESVSERVIEAWFEDPMHKALLLEPTFRYCGIGMMGDGEYWKITLVMTVSLPEEVEP